jgi:hypothetical protein
LLPEECESVRSELRTIVSSPYFRNSKRYPAFLTYIVEKTIQGEGDALKERTIGIEVFGRPADYDTNSDPIVRNAASEVRRRLSLYHAESPEKSPIGIYLPAGSYHPEIHLLPAGVPPAGEPVDLPENPNSAGALLAAREEIAVTERRPKTLRFKRISLVVVLLLLVAFAGLWWRRGDLRRSPLDKLWGQFFYPTQVTLIVVPRAPAPADLDGPFMRGPLEQKDLSNWIRDNPDVAAEDLSAVIHAIKPLMEHNVSYSIQMDSGVTLTDLRDRPVILIGGLSNQWTTKLLAPLRFHFNLAGSLHVEDAQNPQSPECVYVLNKMNASHIGVVEDCSIIARYHDPTTGGVVMVMAGAGRNGTEAAGEFVTSDALLEDLNKRLPRGWQDRNLEIVLKTKVIDGKTGWPSIITAYSW